MPEREPDWDAIMEMEAESRRDAEITEAEAVEYVKHLFKLESTPDCKKATITIGPFTAFSMIGGLQLAMRHPDFSPVQADLMNHLIDQFRPLFAGTPGEQLLRLGDYAAYDIDGACRHPSGPHAPGCPPDGHPGFAAEGPF